MFAIVYNLEEERQIETREGNVVVTKGTLLGYTKFPEDPVWEGRDNLAFVPVESYDMEPLVWKWDGEKWVKINEEV